MSAAKKKKNKKINKKKSNSKNLNNLENKEIKKEENNLAETTLVVNQDNTENKNINEKDLNSTDKQIEKDNSIEELNEEAVKQDKKDLEENEKTEEVSPEDDNKKSEKTSLVEIKKEDEQLVATDKGKPEYVEEMIKNKKRRTYIFICITILIILAICFSTIFALLNMNNSNIINGVSVKNIDVSKLSVEDAKNKVNEAITRELSPEIYLKYGDGYNISLKPEQIEYKYNIDGTIENAYLIGRNNNIVFNNYTLLKTAFIGENINPEYTYNKELLDQFVSNINAEIPGVVVEPSYYIEGTKLIVNKGVDGIEVDVEKLEKEIIDAIFSRKAENIIDDSFKQEIEIPVKEKKADNIDMAKIREEIYKQPQDAYFETDPYKIYPDVDGVDLSISAEEAQKIIDSENKEEYSFDLNITKAQKTIKDLGKEAFPYLVSSFSTKYDASNTDRSTNLKLSASKINGTVLMPGEEFSYNKTVGKRTVEAGYKDAKIYENGAVVDGLGGGICQISSTLYNAVLLANLEVTERKNHSYTTSYVAAGRDATVVYGVKDFKFKNSRNYPIKIETTVNNGIAEFKIYGVQEEKEYEVRILPVTTASIPYTTSYVQDATLAPGQQVVSQSGHPGYKVTTYKEVRYNGEVISKNIISNDTYSPMQTIIRVGPGVPVPAQ